MCAKWPVSPASTTAVSVVPMPVCSTSSLARWKTAALACSAAARSNRPSATAAASVSAASPLATSPAWAPPMPSQTANRGGATTKVSSLVFRCRPMSVRAPGRATRLTGGSLLVTEDGLADAHPAVELELRLAAHLLLVHERAVGAAQVLHVVEGAARHEARVRARDEMLVEHDVARRGAAHGDPAVQRKHDAGRDDGALFDDETRIDVTGEVELLAGDGAFGQPVVAARLPLGRREHGDGPRARRKRDVRSRRAGGSAHRGDGRLHDLPDEQVEQDEDADLEDEQDNIDHGCLPQPVRPRSTAAAFTWGPASRQPL